MADGGRALDELAALRLQVEWGADEALLAEPWTGSIGRCRGPDPAASAIPTARPCPPAGAAWCRLPPVPDWRPNGLPRHEPRRAVRRRRRLRRQPAARHRVHHRRAERQPALGPVAGRRSARRRRRPRRARLSGPAGERLDHLLRSAGLGRDDLLLALLVPWRAPGGRPISEAERAAVLPFFHRLLALVRPRRLMLMGAVPACGARLAAQRRRHARISISRRGRTSASSR